MEIYLGVALLLVIFIAGFFWLSKKIESSLSLKQGSDSEQSRIVAEQFELLGRRLFEDSSKKLGDQSLQNLQLLMDPFKERLREFEKKVEEAYATERSERSSLRGELSKMMELNQRMSTEAQNLTRALKGDVRAQGAWGELLLENILERSGLRKDEEYVLQETHKGEEGQLLRPDVIVRLPDHKHIVVDSKMSLISYEEYSRAGTPEEREKWAKDFAISLKRHMDGLSSKKYHALESLGSPDFVILFIPLEPAFALAFQVRPDLFSEAWEKNVAIVSPTTLLTTLRTVAVLWKQDRQEKNALEIADRGGKLYDKFAALVKDFEGLGEQLQKSQKSYDAVMSKLHTGNGNLISQVEKLRELGVKAEKRLIEKSNPPS